MLSGDDKWMIKGTLSSIHSGKSAWASGGRHDVFINEKNNVEGVSSAY